MNSFSSALYEQKVFVAVGLVLDSLREASKIKREPGYVLVPALPPVFDLPLCSCEDTLRGAVDLPLAQLFGLRNREEVLLPEPPSGDVEISFLRLRDAEELQSLFVRLPGEPATHDRAEGSRIGLRFAKPDVVVGWCLGHETVIASWLLGKVWEEKGVYGR